MNETATSFRASRWYLNGMKFPMSVFIISALFALVADISFPCPGILTTFFDGQEAVVAAQDRLQGGGRSQFRSQQCPAHFHGQESRTPCDEVPGTGGPAHGAG